MKQVTSLELAKAYGELNPNENFKFDTAEQVADLMRIFGNWLEAYSRKPESRIATCNWMGKVTKALFYALGMKQPRTKKAMLEALKD